MNRSIAPEVNEITQITLPVVQKATLDNDVPVYILQSGEQDVVKIEFVFTAGKWYEEMNLVSDLTNRLLREGTTKHNGKELADTFDFYGANVNYSAGFETAGASLFSLTRNVKELLPLMHEVFTEAVFPENELQTIANNRKQRLAVDMKKNDYLANRDFVSALYGRQHPYGRLTEPEHYDVVNKSHLQSFFKRHYHAGNLAIIAAGKVHDDVLKTLNQYFGHKDWLGEKAPEKLQHPLMSGSELNLHTERSDSVQTAVVLGNLSINKHHPDFIKVTVLNTLFGGYFGSRLMSNIREEKGYTYGIYSSFVSYPHGGFLEISSEVGKHVREATLAEIEKEIKRLHDELVDEEELQTVKNYMSGKILRSIDGAMKYSETFKNLLIYKQQPTYIEKMLTEVRETTAEQIMQLATTYLQYDKMYKVTVG